LVTKEIEVTLPDNRKNFYKVGTPIKDILLDWEPKQIEAVIAARINGSLVDLSFPLNGSSTISFILSSSPEGLEIFRHSTAHVMAQAVQELFPGALVAIGPAIEDGFYYDFDYERSFSLEDLEKIERRMAEIIAADLPFERRELNRKEAIDLFRSRGELYKVELIEDLPEEVEKVSIYSQGGYVDLCRGPHIPSTGKIKAFKLLTIAGAYWRGDERNKMLQRIYGTSFATKEDLEEHL